MALESVNREYLRLLFAELADDPDGNLLTRLHREGLALMAVEAVEGFFVEFQFQGLLGYLLRAELGEVVQTFLPLLVLVLGRAVDLAAERGC